MDFCGSMSAIEIGLEKGPAFCEQCTRILESIPAVGDAILGLSETFNNISDIDVAERDITKAILLRGQRYLADAAAKGITYTRLFLLFRELQSAQCTVIIVGTTPFLSSLVLDVLHC